MTVLIPKKIKTRPTAIFSKYNILELKNRFARLPMIVITDKKKSVDNMAPVPKRYISFRVISLSVIFEEKTPAQNSIVSGFDRVRIIVFKKTRDTFPLLSSIKFGNIGFPNASKIILKPNKIKTSAPK